MARFKVGDEIICVDIKNTAFLVAGKHYVVSKSHLDYGKVHLKGLESSYFENRFKLAERYPTLRVQEIRNDSV